MIGCHDRIVLLRWNEGMTAGKQIVTAVVYMYFRRYSYSLKAICVCKDSQASARRLAPLKCNH